MKRVMSQNVISVIQLVLVFSSFSFGQIGILLDKEFNLGLNHENTRFLGSANMDNDANEELVYVISTGTTGDSRVYIIDGVTGAIEWDSESFYGMAIAGFNYNTESGSANHGFGPFCDVNNDGIKEITFMGTKTVSDEDKLYVVGINGSTMVEAGDPQTLASPKLSQNYPNPFNPTTIINYELTSKSKVKIDIYNLNGERVRELVNTESQAGEYQVTWDGKNDDGGKVSSGTYFYQLKADEYVSTRKAIFLK